MIWILWLVFIIVEVISHWYVIEVIQFDPTPDGKKTLSHLVVFGYRILVWSILCHFGGGSNLEILMYLLGCLFSHLLLFPILLNRSRGLKADYLGDGFTDKILKLAPFIARVFWLMVLTAGMIYGYYNTDLL